MHIALFSLGQWQVKPGSNTLIMGDKSVVLEPKAMDVLVLLCQQQGEVLSADDILSQCWPSTEVGDNPVHKVITQLRKALGDKASAPEYIETIRKRGYRIIADVLFPFDDQQRAKQTQWQGASPFPGLSAFEPSAAPVFFGRSTQIASLLDGVSQQIANHRAFSLILGPSGTGKSSLVNAGVLPKLMDSHGHDGIRVLSHTSLDFADLNPSRLLVDAASTLLDWDVNDTPVFDGWSAEQLAEKLSNEIDAVIARCQQAIAQNGSNTVCSPRLFLFADRLEVLLDSPLFSDNERMQVLTLLEFFATSDCIIVFSACRNDFYPLVVQHPSLMANKTNGSHFDLLAPTRAELMQMIRLPAVAAGLSWSIEEETATPLDELLCNEAANNPDALPMLQYTLQELYLQRSDSDELSIDVYKALGGIEGAIGKKAEEVYASLDAHHQQELAYVLSQLVTLSSDGETITSRAARWAQLTSPSQNNFVQAMVDSRLFVSHLQNNEPCFSVAHEALLRRWQRATDWINAHRDSLAVRSRLREMTDNWITEDHSPAYLLAQGKPLQEAQSLSNNSSFILEVDEQRLIDASTKRVQHKRWLKRGTISLLCLLTVTSIFMSFHSQHAQLQAQQKRLEAESLLGFMVGEFADKLRSVRRMDLLDGISNKALEYFSSEETQAPGWLSIVPFIDDGRSYEARYQHAQTLLAMGEVAYTRDKTDEAKQAFESADPILQLLLAENATNLALLKTIGANSFWLGQLAYDQSDFDSAQKHFEAYRDASETMNQLEPDNVDGWIELYYAYSTLGSLYLKQQNYAQAKIAFESSLELNDKAIRTRKADNILRADKADTLSWLATTEQHLGNLYKTIELLETGQVELESILETELNNANLMEPLAYSLWQRARLFYYLERFDESYKQLDDAAKLLRKALEQDPNNEIWTGDLLSVQVSREMIANKIGYPIENLELIFEAGSRNNLMRPYTLIEVIKYFHESGKWVKSAEWIEYTQQFLNSMFQMNQDEPDFIAAYSTLKILIARQAAYQKDIENQNLACEQAIKLLKHLVSKSSSVTYLVPYAQAHACLDKLDAIQPKVDALLAMGIEKVEF